MPGVSRKASCPRGSLRMPTMRLRVVCGLAETIETFCPRMRLSSVDLPAFGRPTSATTPKWRLASVFDFSAMSRHRKRNTGTLPPVLQLFLILDRPLRILRNADPIDPAAVGAVDDELVSILLHDGADLRYASGGRENQSGHGLVVVAFQLGIEQILQRLDAQLAADHVFAVAEVDDRSFVFLVLVRDLADDLFDDVFDRDDARRAAVFVDNHRHLNVLALKLAQQFRHFFRLADEVRRTRDLGRRRRLVLDQRFEDFLDVNDADDLVDAPLVNRDARVFRIAEEPRQFIERMRGVERQHVDAWRHQLAGHAVAEIDDGLDHLAFRAFEDSFLFANVDVRLHFFVGDFFVLVRFLFLPIEAVEHAAHREEHGPEEDVEKMRERDQRLQDHLADVFGNECEDEFPHDHDEEPDDRRDPARDRDRLPVECSYGRDEGADQRDLQQRAADQPEILRIEVQPAAAALLGLVARPAPQRDRADLLREVADRVEEQKKNAADRREDDPGDLRNATTSHWCWRPILSTEEKRDERGDQRRSHQPLGANVQVLKNHAYRVVFRLRP